MKNVQSVWELSSYLCSDVSLFVSQNQSSCVQSTFWIFCIRDLLEQDIPVIFASVKEVTIMKTAVIYARVSSSNDRQNTQRQIEDLTQLASRNDYQLMGTYEEHISGATKNENRMVLMECISYCIEHQVNYLLLSELSRLGRSTLQVLKSLEMLHESGVSVYIQILASILCNLMERLIQLPVLWLRCLLKWQI